MKKQWYYEVRIDGDNEHDYFSVPPSHYDGNNFRYNPRILRSARHYAKHIGGYVVRLTVESV